jgi:hypothetical protein
MREDEMWSEGWRQAKPLQPFKLELNLTKLRDLLNGIWIQIML